VFCQTFGLFFARKEISMRDVAILVDGGFYLKRYKKQTDGKQVAKGLLTHQPIFTGHVQKFRY
jgi:hypothetical protein